MNGHGPLPAEIPVKTVLENTGHALANLATIADHLDEIVGDLVIGSSSCGRGPPDATKLQRVDLLRQSIHALATLVTNLAQAQPPDATMARHQVVDRVSLQWIREACLSDPLPGGAEHVTETTTGKG